MTPATPVPRRRRFRRSGEAPAPGGRWVHPTEDAAAAQAAARTPLATLLTSHILRDGELVLLILKPSLWFIPLQSLIFAAGVLLVAIAANLIDPHVERRDRFYFEAAVFLIAGRVMWSALQWMGRLYVLTDLRILRLSGVFTVDIFDCPLRKVAQTRLVATLRERLFWLGSIEVHPRGEGRAPTLWQTIGKPAEIHAKVCAAISRAKQSGFGGE